MSEVRFEDQVARVRRWTDGRWGYGEQRSDDDTEAIRAVMQVYDDRRNMVTSMRQENEQLRAEVAELRRDKERLDWLETWVRSHHWNTFKAWSDTAPNVTAKLSTETDDNTFEACDIRTAIDAAREGK